MRAHQFFGNNRCMAYDVVIRNGLVVDGSGFGAYRADVGIVDGTIARVGRIRERARPRARRRRPRGDAGLHRRPHPPGRPGLLGPAGRELVLARRDHRGDGQLRLHPRARARRRPGAGRAQPRAGRGHRPHRARAASSGAGRRSRSTSAAVDRLPKAINYAANVGHSALRTWAMGERAFEQEATDADLELDAGSARGRAARRRDRPHDLAQRAPRDLRRPSGRVAARRRGTSSAGWSASWATSAPASSKVAASTCCLPIPSSASRPGRACARWPPTPGSP